MAALNKVREAMQGNIATMETYRVRTGQVLSAQDAWQKKIREGKATFTDFRKNHGMFNEVLKDQLALQKAMGLGWSQSSKTGKFSTDMFIPKTLDSRLNTTMSRIGMFSKIVNVASDNLVNWGKNTQWAGRQLMVGFTVPLGIAAAATGKMAYDLEKQLTQVVKVYGDVTSGMQETSASIRNSALDTAKAAARVYGQSAETTLGIMADLAASGKSGMELQQATMSTTRAAILGELDWQDAVKATISMQEVYQASQQDLADNWNYINAMENQTVLSAQDFVTAIPKVSGVMNELGADLKDTGLLLTAFKAAGIDAAEGANALKSINFRLVASYGKGLETFKANTGKDLKEIIKETNGETIPSLMKFADAIKNLSAPQKIAVTRDVFGIYQGSKALMLIEQMTKKTEQFQNALDVANNSNIENAAIAQQELDRQNDQPYKKLDKAIASLKIELGTLGEAFLEPAAKILDFITKLVQGFNGLNPTIKLIVGGLAAIVAVAGPIVMLVGLFANLLATTMKFGSSLTLMATRFKFVSEQEQLQQIISSRSTNIWNQEAASVAMLTKELQVLTAAFQKAQGATQGAAQKARIAAKLQASADKIYAGYKVPEQPVLPYQKNTNGQYIGSTGIGTVPTAVAEAGNAAKIAQHEKLIAVKKQEAMATAQLERAERLATKAREAEVLAMQEQAIVAERAAAKVALLTRAISGAAFGASMLAGAVGPQEGVGGGVIKAVEAFALLGMVAPKTLAKVGVKALSILSPLKGVGTAALGGIKTAGASMLGYLKVAGPIIAAIGIAGMVIINKWNDEIEKKKKETEDFINFAKNSADTLGYSYTNAGQLDVSGIKDGQKAAEVLVEKMKEVNKTSVEAFAAMKNASPDEQWRTAISAGIDAKLHGATVQQAKDTTRMALQAMGQSFKDAEFEVQISTRVDFENMDKMVQTKIAEWGSQMKSALQAQPVNAWEGFWNNADLTQSSGAVVSKMGNDFWALYFAADKDKRRGILTQVANENDKFINDAFKKAQARNPESMKFLGMNNAHDFSKGLAQGTFSATSLGMTDDEFNKLHKQNDALTQMAQAVAMASGMSKDAVGPIRTFWDLFQQETVTGYMGKVASATEDIIGPTDLYDQKINNVLLNGGKLNQQKIDQINTDLRVEDGTYKTGDALQYLGDVSRGAAMDTETMNEKMKELGYNSAITADTVVGSWKSIYGGTRDAIFDEAGRQYEEMNQGILDRLQKKGEKAVDALDKKGDTLDKKQEKASKVLDDRLDKEKKAFDKAWEARKKRESDVYDARIKKIEDTIQAEQDAEAMRQKIFEAEQTRIQRLSEMFNTNVDINMAVNSGQMDEAAKLMSNASAQELQWATSDSAANSQTSSEKRIQDLNDEKDKVTEAKNARMDALKEIEDREKDVFQKKQDRRKEDLKADQDAAKKSLDIQKKELQAKNAADEKRKRDSIESDKRRLEGQLSVLREFLPSNKAELDWQQKELTKIYDAFGLKLGRKGNDWGKTVSDALKTNVQREGNALKTTVNWSKVGADIANSMLQGAFGMDAKTFAAWLNGGKAPDGTPFGAPKVKPKHRGQMTDLESRHTGGVIGSGGGSRAGWSGNQKPSEVMINALRGEGMVNRKGMKVLGKDGLDSINSGKGGGGLGLGSLPGAMIGATGKLLVQSAIGAAYKKRMGDESGFGSKVGVQTDISSFAGNAIASLGSSIAYKSGKVVYLGHGGYSGGGDFSGNVRPAAGKATSPFGPRNLLGMSFHNGLDIANAAGTPIKAAQGGRVIFTGWDNTGYGNYTEIQSGDGTMYGYGHQSQIGVRAGQNVRTGQQIGLMGSTGKSTGPHLHFQIGRNGNWFNPRDVMPQLNTGGFIKSDGLAKLHKEETVLTKPLSRELNDGIKNIANDKPIQYNVTLDFNGASFNRGIDFQKEVETALTNIDRKNGGTRRIGGK